MPPNLPKPICNLLALFFATWCATSTWLLVGGEASPVVRLAFAICGIATLFAGSVGGLFHAVGRLVRWLFRGKLGACLATSVVLFFLWATFSPIFTLSAEKVRLSSTMSNLKDEWRSLDDYAKAHNDILPPDMRDACIHTSLLPYRTFQEQRNYPPYGKPFVWCKELAGLRLDDIAKPYEVVASYSRAHIEGGTNREIYVALFLDGHTKRFTDRQELLHLIRQRPALLAHAVRAKAKRYADAKSSTKKVAP